jgi:hypothetical protein
MRRNKYNSNRGFLKDCDKEENLEVSGAASTSVWKEDCKYFCPMSRIRPVIGRPAPQWHNLLTLHTTPDLCTNVLLAVLFGRNGNSYTVSTRSDLCIYTLAHNKEKLVGQKK